MRLASFATAKESRPRIGIVIAQPEGDILVDAEHACMHLAADRRLPMMASHQFPADMRALLEEGEPALALLRNVEDAVRSALEEPARAAGLEAVAVDRVTLYPPVPRPGKIIMVGGNYGKHRREVRSSAVDVPSALLEERAPSMIAAFAKFPSVQIGHKWPLPYPRHTKQLDYEAELGVVIGKRCKDVRTAEYADVVAGYTIVNDVSMRDLQFPEMKAGSTMMGKNLDGAMPNGPYLVFADEVGDPQKLRLVCRVNGEVRQSDTTANMTHSLAELVAYFSRMTLEPGDIISTGTPAGVGIFWNPPEHGLLRVGDAIEIEIEHLGTLANTVVAESKTGDPDAS